MNSRLDNPSDVDANSAPGAKKWNRKIRVWFRFLIKHSVTADRKCMGSGYEIAPTVQQVKAKTVIVRINQLTHHHDNVK